MLFDVEPVGAMDTREGLLAHLQVVVPRPNMPSASQVRTMSAAQRQEFDDLRLRYVSGGILLQTPQIEETLRKVYATILSNRNRVVGRSSVLISGRSTMGKTTACVAAMRQTLDAYTGAFPRWETEGQTPVVYFEVPAGATAKSMMGRPLEFFGVPVSRSTTLEERTRLVVMHLKHARTRLVVVDEVHNLSRPTAGTREATEVLKGLCNDVAATFIFSGINVRSSGFLEGEHGAQFHARSKSQLLTPFPIATAADRAKWKELLNGIENELLLLGHAPQTFAREWLYLHQRTGGAIGRVVRLLTSAAIDHLTAASEPENEHITREQLERIPADEDYEAWKAG